MSKPNVGILATKDWVTSLINKVIKKGFNGYSNDEKVIGTWTDGKPIYRKVFEGNTEIGTNLAIVLSSISIDTLIKCYGNLKTIDSGMQTTILSDNQALVFHNDNITIYVNNSASASYTYKIILSNFIKKSLQYMIKAS